MSVIAFCQVCGKSHTLLYDGYKPNVDYKIAHLEWLLRTKNFVPSVDVFESSVMPYYDTMKELYRHDSYIQGWAYDNLMKDMAHHRKVNGTLLSCMNVLSEMDNVKGKYFVTIGFNHQTYTDTLMKKYMETVITFDWVQSLLGKFEVFRTNGQHPHVHMILETQLSKSKIIEKLMRCKGGSKLILGKSFIDVKVYQPFHDDYIHGRKTEDKMACVESDVKYREERCIPEFYVK